MDLLQLRYFCYAAGAESFAKAAEHFRVPPSGISQSVKRLETELGLSLFDRTANRISLNAAGALFYQKVSEALSILDNAKNYLQNEENQVLRILVENNRHTVMLAAERFSKDYPTVSLSFHYRPKDGEVYDMVVSDLSPADTVYDSIRLVTEPFVLAMKKEHPLAKHSSLRGDELKKERFVCMPRGNSLYDMLLSFCLSHGFTPTFALESDDPATIRHCIENGVGVGLVPAFSWKGLFSEAVALIPVEGLSRTSCLFYRADLPLTPERQAFLDSVRAAFTHEPS